MHEFDRRGAAPEDQHNDEIVRCWCVREIIEMYSHTVNLHDLGYMDVCTYYH